MPSPSKPAGGSVLPGPDSPIAGYVRLAAQALFFLGLVGIIGFRSCDTLSTRSVAYSQAQYQLARSAFAADFDRKIADKRLARDNLVKKENKSAEDEKTISQYNDDITKLENERRSEEQRLEATTWSSYRTNAQNASAHAAWWNYWLFYGFILGSMTLAAGAALLAFSGSPAERWGALAILAILVFSVYVLGMVWN
jgi:hypothetical protein